MKNNYCEIIKRTFNKPIPTKYRFKNKVCRHQSFAKIGPSDLTWYSEFSFRLNGDYIYVDWIHPRTAFEDLVFSQAVEQAKVIFDADPKNFLMRTKVPMYKKLKKHHVKILGWITLPTKISSDAFASLVKLTEETVMKERDFIVKPNISVKWRKYGKFVSVCVPFEVRSVSDVAALSVVLKQILKHEIGMEEAFNHYQYTRLNWFEEFQSNKME